MIGEVLGLLLPEALIPYGELVLIVAAGIFAWKLLGKVTPEK